MNAKSETVQKGLLDTIKEAPEVFNSITFDNGSEFSQTATLEDEDEFDVKIYFCHAYSAWERDSNENFNKLLREFIPKGISLHQFTDDVIETANKINQRIREVNDYQSAEEVFWNLNK